MVCVESGEVIEFFNEDIETLQRAMAKEHGFELLDHNLVLYVRPLPDSGGDE
jgi:Fur family ferric uptake transcriptional regulator